MPTQPIEVNSEPTGTAQKDQGFFHADDVELPFEKQLRHAKLKMVHTEPPVITVLHCHRIEKCINTPMHNKPLLKEIPRVLIENDADAVLLNFERQMLGLPFDEQIVATNPRNIVYCRNKN